MSWQADSNAATINVLQTFNHRPMWDQAKAPRAKKIVTGHRRNFRSDETEYVNAYGSHGVEIICLAADFPEEPVKFDRFTVAGEVYTVKDVRHKNGFDNTVLFYACLCTGV